MPANRPRWNQGNFSPPQVCLPLQHTHDIWYLQEQDTGERCDCQVARQTDIYAGPLDAFYARSLDASYTTSSMVVKRVSRWCSGWETDRILKNWAL